jgi:pyruvoyl-dependent arginine decarboxylase (PvlArgDC)
MSNLVSSTSLGPQILEILGVKSDVVTDFQIFFEAGELVTCSITRMLTEEEGEQIASVLEGYVLTRLGDPDSEDYD